MADIVLIQPPIRDFYLTAKRTIPHGLTCIAANLELAGFSVTLLDALATRKMRPVDMPAEMAYLEEYYGTADLSPFALFHRFRHYGYAYAHIGALVARARPFLVGIAALFTAYRDEARAVAQTIKTAWPACRIVVGGHHATALPEDVMSWPGVDYIIRGEAEQAMVCLARALKNGDDPFPSQVPGIVFRRDDGTLHLGAPVFLDDLDQVPAPDFALVKHDFYSRSRRRCAVVTASRGCPFSCSYCAVAGMGIPFRRRRVAAVLAEIRTLVDKFDVRFIDFEDENLCLDKNWFKALLEGIVREFDGLGLELRAMNGLFPGALDQETVQMMKAAGFRSLNLSVGTFQRRGLTRFNRPDVSRAFLQSLAWAAQNGLEAVGYIVVGAPDQPPEESLADLLTLAGQRVLAGISVFYPAPGSADWTLCQSKGLLPDDFSLMRSTALPIAHRTSRRQVVTLLRLGRILNFIKSLIRRRIPLPVPAPGDAIPLRPQEDRTALGIQLLQWFLHDGIIRGQTPEGEIFEHLIDAPLAREFARRILAQRVLGH